MTNLEIVRIKGLKFGNDKAYTLETGHVFYNKELGYLSFKHSNELNKYGVKTPYKAAGGKKAMQEIIDCGGFTNYDDIEWIKPLNN